MKIETNAPKEKCWYQRVDKDVKFAKIGIKYEDKNYSKLHSIYWSKKLIFFETQYTLCIFKRQNFYNYF